MAGDWIKMRSNLWDDPRVSRLVDLTDSSETSVVGGLYWLWASADQHSEDGIMQGLTLKAIDRKTGIKGFGDALVAIGWIADHPEGVRIVRFEEHNGKSAKRRCSESVRKMSARDADNFQTESGQDADNFQTESGQDAEEDQTESGQDAHLEKEKEKEKDKQALSKLSGFDDFWFAYPKKKNKGDAEKAWKAVKPSADLLKTILEAVEVAKLGDDWRKENGKFIPYPASWLRAKGWEDDRPTATVIDIDRPKPGDKRIINGAELTYYAGLGFAL